MRVCQGWNVGVTAGGNLCASGWDTNRVLRKEEADRKWFAELSKDKLGIYDFLPEIMHFLRRSANQ